jgi:death-on-curing protein
LRTGSRHYRVTLKDILEAHKLAIVDGGLEGVRDLGAIEAAIARPYSGYYRSIAGKAAALVHSLALNHGFIDANKRTTLYACQLLVMRSGYNLRAGDLRTVNQEMEEMIVAVVEHRMDFDALVAWFAARIVRSDD